MMMILPSSPNKKEHSICQDSMMLRSAIKGNQVFAPRHAGYVCCKHASLFQKKRNMFSTSEQTEKSRTNGDELKLNNGPSSVAAFKAAYRSAGYRLWDILRTGSFKAPPNPILTDISEIQRGEMARGIFYPKFDEIEPRHFNDAMEEVVSHTQLAHQEMEETFRKILTAVEKNSLDEIMFGRMPLEDAVLQNLYRIQFPSQYLRNLLELYMKVKVKQSTEDYRMLQMAQMKLNCSSTILTPTNAALILLTKEHVQEKQEQVPSDQSKRPQDKKHYDELEVKRRALEWILERDGSLQEEQNYECAETEEDTLLQIAETLQELSLLKMTNSIRQPNTKYALAKIYKVLTLRHQKARSLGYNSYADFFLSKNMMIKNSQEISSLHNTIAQKALPVVLQHIDQWMEEEKRRTKRGSKSVTFGDAFSSSRNKPSVWGELALYLEMETVLKGMFDLCRRLFGVVVKEETLASRIHQTWDRDVRIFHLFDEDKEMTYLASFYLDPFKRPENKMRDENFCLPLIDGAMQTHTTALSGHASVKTMPLACVVCDIMPPDWNDSPCFLSFDETVNIFHEFGHALHQMLTVVDFGFVAGLNAVEFDAVESPPQLFSLFLYDEGTLKGFAKHYRTGQQIPDELFDELIRERLCRSSLRILEQAFEGQLEIEMHAAENESILQILEKCYDRFMPYRTKVEKGDFSKVVDILVDGNPEFRCRYLISEVMSCDAFAAFEEVGLSNDAEVKALGRKYRETILSVGGGCSASEAYRRFRGRDFNTEAFFNQNGLF